MGFEYKLIATFVASLLSTFLVIWFSRWLSLGIDSVKGVKKHGTHKKAVPRLGGIGIFLGFTAGYHFLGLEFLTPSLILCVAAPFALGLMEDVTQSLSAQFRFLVMALFSLATVFFVEDSLLYNIGFDLPAYAAVPLTILVFTCLTNAINIIDGFNGLAAGISLLAFSALAIVAFLHHRPGIFACSLTMLFSTAGFLFFNFPSARIFLGDGGAYFIGFTLALLSALLINRTVGIVSPWFPVAILLYPIMDTLFSVYRRKVLKGKGAFTADLLHMHSLVYKRVSRRNHLTSLYVILFNLPFTVFAVMLHRSTPALMILCALYCVAYITVYMAIVNFRVKRVVGGVPGIPNGQGVKLL